MKYMHWSRQDLDQCNYEDFLGVIDLIHEEQQEQAIAAARN